MKCRPWETEMTPEDITDAKNLLDEHEELVSLCDELQKSGPRVYVGQSDDVGKLLRDTYPEARYRIGKLLWDELRALIDSTLASLADLGVDVSELRTNFETQEWKPASWDMAGDGPSQSQLET
jgi:hypothetical protein